MPAGRPAAASVSACAVPVKRYGTQARRYLRRSADTGVDAAWQQLEGVIGDALRRLASASPAGPARTARQAVRFRQGARRCLQHHAKDRRRRRRRRSRRRPRHDHAASAAARAGILWFAALFRAAVWRRGRRCQVFQPSRRPSAQAADSPAAPAPADHPARRGRCAPRQLDRGAHQTIGAEARRGRGAGRVFGLQYPPLRRRADQRFVIGKWRRRRFP